MKFLNMLVRRYWRNCVGSTQTQAYFYELFVILSAGKRDTGLTGSIPRLQERSQVVSRVQKSSNRNFEKLGKSRKNIYNIYSNCRKVYAINYEKEKISYSIPILFCIVTVKQKRRLLCYLQRFVSNIFSLEESFNIRLITTCAQSFKL